MEEVRYHAFKRLINGSEQVLDNGNRIVDGTIGNYHAQLELRRLHSSGWQLLLNMDDSNKYGRRTVRYWELYENRLYPKIKIDVIENKDPEFQGKIKTFFSYTRKKIFRDFIGIPGLTATMLYLYNNKILGSNPLTSVLGSIFYFAGFYIIHNIPSIIIERKKSIERVRSYNMLKKLLESWVQIPEGHQDLNF